MPMAFRLNRRLPMFHRLFLFNWPADDFIDELASDGVELVLANPVQNVGWKF